ncbi:NAD(P)H-dependent oxidoreductase [Thermophagus xiamenensis]|uniref:NAD(P)H dehydrogenase (Quinone) n=1 Tax=Thermophagus xiamenensis TaxID=385682 RepID=A0A1I2BV22_9BACT|nr:NAD(P)H-dependent oxidoreductase [Thermophagus xiamenensis]SFE59778.1 NAD(P)H dehydrogenase (quinone) [Thermophagus xiamenensis]
MQHLIISAHPNQNSFSNALAEALAAESLNHKINPIRRNLYDIDFNPILTNEDLGQIKEGRIPEDIYREQTLIKEADIISFIYPLWWGSFPAILKGYFDRVLTNGFAFKISSNGPEGLLKGKKVVLHTSMGNSVEEYEKKGILDAFRQIHGDEVFGFCGIEIAGHYFYPRISDSSPEIKKQYIEKALQNYNSIFSRMHQISV